jgi:hypothetical protein
MYVPVQVTGGFILGGKLRVSVAPVYVLFKN